MSKKIEGLKAKLYQARLKKRQTELARVKVDDHLTKKTEAYKAIHAAVYQADEDADAAVKKLEAELREEAVAIFKATKDKKPASGVDIKEYKEYEFIPEKALEWAKSKEMALKLDDTAFHAICESDELRPDFVTERKVPKAYIAKDLSKHVPKDALPTEGRTTEAVSETPRETVAAAA